MCHPFRAHATSSWQAVPLLGWPHPFWACATPTGLVPSLQGSRNPFGLALSLLGWRHPFWASATRSVPEQPLLGSSNPFWTCTPLLGSGNPFGLGQPHYGSKVFKSTHGGKRSLTHSPHSLHSAPFRCSLFHSAALCSNPFCSTALQSAPLPSAPLHSTARRSARGLVHK